jgi:hypothetical protein
MKREIITIENGLVSVPQSGEVRMTACEIAALFEVYVQTVHANIKAVLKSGVIKADGSCAATVAGNTLMPDVYGLDMITALAFRVHSPKAEMFREWIIHKITANYNPLPSTLLIRLSKQALAN